MRGWAGFPRDWEWGRWEEKHKRKCQDHCWSHGRMPLTVNSIKMFCVNTENMTIQLWEERSFLGGWRYKHRKTLLPQANPSGIRLEISRINHTSKRGWRVDRVTVDSLGNRGFSYHILMGGYIYMGQNQQDNKTCFNLTSLQIKILEQKNCKY